MTIQPEINHESIGWHLFDVTVVAPLARVCHPLRLAHHLGGGGVHALNLQHDQLPDSAFFTNRDLAHVTPDAIRWGPTRPDDLPQPPLVVTKPKTEGKTPGFFVTDQRGVRYLVKLDPVDAPELLSGAEVVTSKLLYALGYHVPSYEAVFLRPDALTLQSGVMQQGRHGHRTPFTQEALDAFLRPRMREGLIRGDATKILDGNLRGPASFDQFRDCAEIRALKLVYAWVNNIDAKDHNSLLVWTGQETVGYLIDFGTSLGADAGDGRPKELCAGWTYMVDLPNLSLELLTLGVYRPRCGTVAPLNRSSIGYFTAEIDPPRWKPYAPNLAFEEMTREDARWIARRMRQLSHEQIVAAVAAGRYHDPADAAYLVEVLEQRRQKIVDAYLKE